jgi:asparagine synthase (glutamine-hydrolysing)
MSIIFGIRKAKGQTVESQQLLDLARTTDRYAPDGTSVLADGRVGMGFQPCHTHQRSSLESAPAVDAFGNMLTFDGRLDNYEELLKLLDIYEDHAADSLIVLTAFERWGEDCFSRFIGDWALALWSHRDRSLYLARDHAGTRTLFFQQANGQILWSTFLETFFIDGRVPDLNEDYAACYLASQPIRDRTLYRGIKSVLPAHYLRFSEDNVVRKPHWQWMSKGKIHYKTDAEYEEHFLSLLRQSVERRTGPGAPILAHLSGGMDSTSIVCLSDLMRKEQGRTTAEFLDTVSFYDDSEPSWNEKPYFTVVEERRGKRGIHIETSVTDRTFGTDPFSEIVNLYPSTDNSAIVREQKLLEAIKGKNYKSILSGFGGDEVLGGVPTPLPELADHLVFCRLKLLFRQLTQWSLVERRPAIHLLLDTVRFALDLYWPATANRDQMPHWLPTTVKERACELSQHDPVRMDRFGLRPSTICNGIGWWGVMESSPGHNPGLLSRVEHRYPYLDRDLIEYLFAVPREQLILPGRRRSLMKRALRGIVPEEILERRRKAFLIRGPLASLRQGATEIDQLFSNSLAARLGVLELRQFKSSLDSTIKEGDPKQLSSLLGTISFERLLRSVLVTNSDLHTYPTTNQFCR